MYRHNRNRQEKAERLCNGGSPSMRKYRDDGGGVGDAGGPGDGGAINPSTVVAPPVAAPATPPDSMLGKPAAGEMLNGVKTAEPATLARPINSDATDKLGVTP